MQFSVSPQGRCFYNLVSVLLVQIIVSEQLLPQSVWTPYPLDCDCILYKLAKCSMGLHCFIILLYFIAMPPFNDNK